jgi:hypothetical protein
MLGLDLYSGGDTRLEVHQINNCSHHKQVASDRASVQVHDVQNERLI